MMSLNESLSPYCLICDSVAWIKFWLFLDTIAFFELIVYELLLVVVGIKIERSTHVVQYLVLILDAVVFTT